MVLCLLSYQVLAQAEPRQQLIDNIEQRLHLIDIANRKHLAYSMRREYKGETYLLRYSGMQESDQQWLLLDVDGEPPNKKHQKIFSDYIKGRQKEDKNREQKRQMSAMIQPDSLQFIREDSEGVWFSFAPRMPSMNDAALQHLQGELLVAPKTAYLRRLKVSNERPFSPAFPVKIKQFLLLLEFSYREQRDLLIKSSFSLQGKAALVKNIDFESVERYFDYDLSPVLPLSAR